jgi:hypothetical protein
MKITPEELEKHVRESHELALAGDIKASQKVLTPLIYDQIATAAEIKEVMDKIDPKRVVWNGYIPADATGLRGLPLVEAKYILASNVYGHEISRSHGDPDAFEAFIDACENAYDDGTLHDAGHVVVERETGRYLFLVTQIIDDEPVAPEDVAEIGASYGIQSSLMAFNHDSLESGGRPGAVCLTAVIDSSEQFPLVEKLSDAFNELIRSTWPVNKM